MDIINNILMLVVFSIVVEAITEILTAGKIFFGLRNWLQKKSNFFGSMISCGYCLSVWVSMLVAVVYPFEITNIMIIDYILWVFILHRFSNIIHEGFSRWFNRHPFLFFITMNREEHGQEDSSED